MWKVFVFMSCVLAVTLPAAVDMDDDDDELSPEDVDEILSNPRLYRQFIDCQQKKLKCRLQGKPLREIEEKSHSQVLAKELGDENGGTWAFLYSLAIPLNETVGVNKTSVSPPAPVKVNQTVTVIKDAPN